MVTNEAQNFEEKWVRFLGCLRGGRGVPEATFLKNSFNVYLIQRMPRPPFQSLHLLLATYFSIFKNSFSFFCLAQTRGFKIRPKIHI